ncbi:formate dehydrogenase accessory sulfurtransferase FdhD [Candidatus Acetothermia bacterium]|nr:formate dehydrogenase accessory sulfurtransferase FdhD [Candidatus Acetothermia bacterium]
MTPRRSTAKVDLLKANGTSLKPQRDLVAVEEPLEIRLDYEDACGHRAEQSISITMRTPGEDFELAVGFLFSEGIIQKRSQVEQISYCVGAEKDQQQGCESLPEGLTISPEKLSALPERLRQAQAVFDKTGGLHAAALFDSPGNLLSLH